MIEAVAAAAEKVAAEVVEEVAVEATEEVASKAVKDIGKASSEEFFDVKKPIEYDGKKKVSEKAEFDPKKPLDVLENADKVEEGKLGGSYKDVFTPGEGEYKEVNHMPPDCVTELSRDDGPAIKMDKEDHKQTASWGNSAEAREYRTKQKELIDNGKFREALQMDIDDIREKFGDKYDTAISQMLEYVDTLEKEGKI